MSATLIRPELTDETLVTAIEISENEEVSYTSSYELSHFVHISSGSTDSLIGVPSVMPEFDFTKSDQNDKSCYMGAGGSLASSDTSKKNKDAAGGSSTPGVSEPSMKPILLY